MIRIDGVTCHLGTRCIFEQTNLSIYPHTKIGVIGKNGVGKSTLFNLLIGDVSTTKGECYLPKSWKIAHISQHLPEGTTPALDYVVAGDLEYLNIHNKLQTAEKQKDHVAIIQAHNDLHIIDGYRIPSKAANILKGLGFSDAQMQQPLNVFSGGWRMRLNVAKTLMARADLFLLDEPTNHLDLDAIVWLEQWIKNCPATVLCITHDAAFLNNIAEYILLIENKKCTLFKGDYCSYVTQKAAQLALQQASFEKQRSHQERLQKFIDRFRAKATKAKQAQARIKALAKLPKIAAIQETASFNFEFANIASCPNPVLQLENIEFSYINQQTKNIFKKLNFYIKPGSRIALLGLNGAGKSTLIKLLAGTIKPQKGVRQLGPNLKIGYFAQEQAEVFPKDYSPLQWFEQMAKHTITKEIRAYLGRFLFSDDKALQKISSLSGGERARLALAWIVWQQPQLLLLDEPTNHLDLDMRQALALALQSFAGAMVLVSHDRQLIMDTADELWWVNNGTVEAFVGDLTDYEIKLKKARS